MATTKRGLEAKLYYQEGGQSGGGGYVEITNVRDVTLGGDIENEDASSRASEFKKHVLGLTDMPLSFSMLDKSSDTALPILRAAWVAKDLIAFKVLDAASGDGIAADYFITKFERSEPLSGPITYDVEAVLADSDDEPTEIIGT